ncbi:hypothetical protein JRO89_XS07G0298800 [Xanthoceras sorbifolium]|uniref:Secreted protein n=1 Tax=Xanthoceras sorbifolium TaxID=99658 RepID=A0ABQ8HVR7_9ROSI|nr:hypothetical protein JRO89_XS07G0298800 [Xanthoceras sorbifolium]
MLASIRFTMLILHIGLNYTTRAALGLPFHWTYCTCGFHHNMIWDIVWGSHFHSKRSSRHRGRS